MQNLKNYKTQVAATGLQDSVLLQDSRVTLQQASRPAQVQDVCEQRGFLFYKWFIGEKLPKDPFTFKFLFVLCQGKLGHLYISVQY